MLTIDYFMIGLLLLLSPQIVRNFKELFSAFIEGISGIIALFKK